MNYTLTSKGYSATVSSCGAELKSFKTPEGKEYIWQADPAFWNRSSPLLFPTIGNVRNDKTIFNKRIYTLEKHGFVRDMEFENAEQTEDSLLLRVKSTPETMAVYPFPFILELRYVLQENRLNMTYTVMNDGDARLPFQLGAHPGFNCPLFSGESLTDYRLVFEKSEPLVTTVYDLEHLCFSSEKKTDFGETDHIDLEASLFDNDALFFRGLSGRSISLMQKSGEHGVKLDYPGFKTIAIWTPSGGKAPFVCLEPWNGCAIFDKDTDEFTNNTDVMGVAPYQESEFELTITVF